MIPQIFKLTSQNIEEAQNQVSQEVRYTQVPMAISLIHDCCSLLCNYVDIDWITQIIVIIMALYHNLLTDDFIYAATTKTVLNV